MADHVSVTRRSFIMSQIKGKNTTPELTVRKAAHKLGLRYRLHVNSLAGRPDLVFPKWKIVIFVHGCFWHGHLGCKKSRLPKTNKKFWKTKIRTNMARDVNNCKKLQSEGWQVITLWQCEVKTIDNAGNLLLRYFNSYCDLQS